MAVDIVLDQAAKPAGVAGVAREDLDVGVDVTAGAIGGPFSAYAWSLIDRPIDIIGASQATTVPTTPTASTTILSPVDVEGTYLLEVLVESGSGLGATAADVARITFYAGATLSTDPRLTPRRRPAFRETTEHNVADAVFAGGNPRGWAQEWERWFAALVKTSAATWASGRVTLTGGGATLVGLRGFNAAVVRTGVGVVDVTFPLLAAPNADYSVLGAARTTAGSTFLTSETTAGFTITRVDAAGAPADADFSFDVNVRV